MLDVHFLLLQQVFIIKTIRVKIVVVEKNIVYRTI